MSINRPAMVIGWVMVLLTGCTAVAPAGAPASPIDIALCSDASVDPMKQALRDVPSYAFQVEGYIEMWEPFTGSEGPLETPDTTTRRPTKSSGAYVAPDAMTQEHELVNERDDIVEARRQIGDDHWVRFVGSRRWQHVDAEPTPANPILRLVDQPQSWEIANSAVQRECVLVGTSRAGTRTQTVTVTVPEGAGVPTLVESLQSFDGSPNWGQAIVQMDSYRIQRDAELTIEPPPIDTSPATAADALYALERRSCLTPPCDVSDVEITSETHQGGVDVFHFERPGSRGQIHFENGEPTTITNEDICEVPADCAPPPSFPPPPRPSRSVGGACRNGEHLTLS